MNLYESQKNARKFRRWIVQGLSAVVFFALTIGIIYGLRPLLMPFIMGAFLAYLFKPLAKKFQMTHWTGYIKLFAFLGGAGVVLYGLTTMVANSLPSESEAIVLKVRLQYRINDRFVHWMGLQNNEKGNFIYQSFGSEIEPLKQQLNHILDLNEAEQKTFFSHLDLLKKNNPEEAVKYSTFFNQNQSSAISDNLKADAEPTALETDSHLAGQLTTPAKSKKSSGFLGQMLKSAAHWIIFPLIFIFMLLDNGQILHFFMRLVPNRYFELTYSVVQSADEALGKYIRGTLIECALVGLSLTIGFYLCGFDFQISFLIGAIGGLTNAIPFVGTAIACVLSAAYALIAENIHPVLPFVTLDNLMLVMIGVVIIVHLLDNAIFQPMVVGKLVNLHPIVVIMGVFGGSLMFGFAGLIFAIPAIVISQVVVKTFFTGMHRYKII